LCIDKNYRFSYPAFPWEEYKQHKWMSIPAMEASKKIDFIGIKLGDLNQSLFQKKGIANAFNSKILLYQFTDQKLIIRSGSEGFINGMQLSMQFEHNCQENISLLNNFLGDNWSEDFLQVHGNEILLSINLKEAVHVKSGEILFEFSIPKLKIICPEVISLSQNFQNEIYEPGNKEFNIVLQEANKSNVEQGLEILEAGPNPTHGKYLIKVSSGRLEELNLECFDVSGKSIHQFKSVSIHGLTNVEIDQQVLSHPGVYFLVMRTAQSKKILKIVVQ
jgi:hypothetical protein